MMRILMLVAALAPALTAAPLVHAADAKAPMARVLRIDGAAMVDHVGEKRRILGLGEALEEQAVVTVAKESFVMLEFRDQSRVTLRPNTVFRVEAYSDDAPEKVSFGLAKGGLRAISGAIGKRKPEVVQINTTSAWIGIRGTEFDARLCQNDCNAEDRGTAPPPTSRATLAARVVELSGVAIATGSLLPTRMLVPGAMIYERDSIATAPDAFVVLAFADGSRVSVSPGSIMAIQQFRFEQSRQEQNTAQLRLFEGGIRVLTGEISQRKPEAYTIDTVVGPIAPRGTLFDAFCTGACVDRKTNASAELEKVKQQAERAATEANAQAGVAATAAPATPIVPCTAANDGLVVHTIEGVVMAAGAEVAKGATAAISERGAQPQFAKQTFAYIAQNKAPRPDLVTVDTGLFSQQKTQSYDPGLYVWVREGSITLNPTDLQQKTMLENDPLRLAQAGSQTLDAGGSLRSGGGPIVVNAGQAAMITVRQVVLLPTVPTFMRFDATPLPTQTRTTTPVSLEIFKAKDGSPTGQCSP